MGKGQLRIIGGQFRGRRLPVPDLPQLRPTPDRVRETLFNWLQSVIAGARCLDLFAGSGALGFEAASRGAAEVVMIERSEPAVLLLTANAKVLDAGQVRVLQADALRWLTTPGMPFGLVFLDPPFGTGMLAQSCELLSRNGWLAPGARIYLESAADQAFPALPGDWRLVRDKRAGQVRYGLAVADGE